MPDTVDFDSITPESIKAEAKQRISSDLEASGLTVDLREGSYTDVLLSECAYRVYKAMMYARSLLDAAVPGPDGGEFLDRFAQTYGLTRAEGKTASVTVIFSGTDGTVIPAGTWVVASSGYRFQTREAVTIASGTARVTADAESHGAAWNVAAGEIIRLQTSIPGVTEVSNDQAAGGVDTESDLSFYTRIHDHLSKPRTSGNVYDYESWALECAGVGYVKVLRLWAGPGTVKVIVAGEDKLPVPETVRAAVAENIDAKRVIGPSVTVVSVTAVPVTITVSCILDSGASADGVEAALTDAVTALLAGFEPGEENTLRYNRILALALSAEGVVDVSALTVNGGTGNITITADQVPRLGAVTVTGVDYE